MNEHCQKKMDLPGKTNCLGGHRDCHKCPPLVKVVLQKKKKKNECNLLIVQCKSLTSGMGFMLSFLTARLSLCVTLVPHPRMLTTLTTN